MKDYDLIKKPILTEKTNIQKEEYNQLSFEVDKRANRLEIGGFIEKKFNVKVVGVRTINVKGKIKRRGKITGKRKDWKKAVVTLRAGERVDFFEGV